MVFAVMYKIDASKKDYSGLYERIKGLGSWMHYSNTGWLVSPSEEMRAKDVYDKLIPFIVGENDNLLVIEVKKHWYGWLPQDGLDWLKKRDFGESAEEG